MTNPIPSPDTPEVRALFRLLIRSKDQYLNLKPGESAIIKNNWALLHEYCKQHEFTLNESGTRIRKDPKPDYRSKNKTTVKSKT